MGWNAAASIIKKDFWGQGDDDINPIPETHPAIADFVQAVESLHSAGQSCDVTMDVGLLCVRSTGAALFAAVGEAMPHSGVRYAAEVQEMVRMANWTLSSDKYDDSNKASAKAFLEICAKHNLGIDLG